MKTTYHSHLPDSLCISEQLADKPEHTRVMISAKEGMGFMNLKYEEDEHNPGDLYYNSPCVVHYYE